MGPFALVVAGGLIVGLAGAWMLGVGTTDRVESALALVADRCVPHVFGGLPFDTEGLVAASTPNSPRWVDPVAQLAVDFDRDCSVTDELARLTPGERLRLEASVEVLGLTLFEDAFIQRREPDNVFEVFTLIGPDSPQTATDVLSIVRPRQPDDGPPTSTEISVMRAGSRQAP